jgi:hypothetical protein
MKFIHLHYVRYTFITELFCNIIILIIMYIEYYDLLNYHSPDSDSLSLGKHLESL